MFIFKKKYQMRLHGARDLKRLFVDMLAIMIEHAKVDGQI
jgi:hypothetical protein